jgi:hypothetical protein
VLDLAAIVWMGLLLAHTPTGRCVHRPAHMSDTMMCRTKGMSARHVLSVKRFIVHRACLYSHRDMLCTAACAGMDLAMPG